MANHTRCAHKKPSLEEVKAAVTKQFHSAKVRSSTCPRPWPAHADLLETPEEMEAFMELYEQAWPRLPLLDDRRRAS